MRREFDTGPDFKSEEYFYVGSTVVEEFDGAGFALSSPLRSYVWARGLLRFTDENGELQFVHENGYGSVVSTTILEGGPIVAPRDYNAYGETGTPLAFSDLPTRFAGGAWTPRPGSCWSGGDTLIRGWGERSRADRARC